MPNFRLAQTVMSESKNGTDEQLDENFPLDLEGKEGKEGKNTFPSVAVHKQGS